MARRQVRVTSCPGSLKACELQPASAFVIQQSSLCVSVTIYVLWVLFNAVCQVTSPATYKAPVCLKPRQRQNIRAKEKQFTLRIVCVSLLTLHYERGYTQFVPGLLESEARRVGSRGGRLPALSGFHCVRFAPRSSLWGDGSGGGNEDGRVPIFFLSHQIQRPLSGIGSLPRGFFPSERGRCSAWFVLNVSLNHHN